ncbi:MAG: O-antigen ligase family protein [Candidatus Paceibacterota bacterium]|jgi:O-antigen ligase/tetratricopeptide (TPR) repeat protein
MPLIKISERILKTILFLVIFATPLIFANSLYMPYVAGKAYFFRLLIELALIPWTVLLFKKPESRPNFKNLLVIALLAMVVVMIITAFTGVDVRRSFFSNNERSDGIIQYIHWILYFLMAISVFKTKKDWQIALSLFSSTALINCIYAFAHRTSQSQLFGLFGNSSYLSGFLIFAIGFCFLFLTNSLKLFAKKIPVAFVLLVAGLILVFSIALVQAQTRGAYLGIFLGFILLVILANFSFWKKSLPDRQAEKKTIIILDVILFVALIFLGLIFIFQNSQFVKSHPIINRVANVAHTTSVQDRLSEWNTAIKGFKDKPILGWGPENFDVVTNKYYNYRVGLYEPWFDRPHNQAFQYLAEGGIILFAAYLFLVAMVLRSIFKIYRKEKVLGSFFLAIYVAYIIQSLILFDALPMFLGLFTLLALVYFFSESSPAINVSSGLTRPKNNSVFFTGIVILTILILVLIRYTVFIPFTGNKLIIKAYEDIGYGEYEKLNVDFDKLFSIRSPYVYVDARRAIGWEFLKNVLDNPEITDANRAAITASYQKIAPELENWMKYRPVDPQVYYVLGASYRLGFQKLNQQDALPKAEVALKKSLNYSANRIEYIDELGQVLVLENKIEEFNELMKKFVSGVDINDPYRYLSLGHAYFIQGNYTLAMDEYTKAKDLGQKFWQSDRDYYRYIQTAEQLQDWPKIIEMTQEYLKNRGEDVNNIFNLAVAQLYAGDIENARINFNKAVQLNPDFEQYRSSFQ